MVSTCTHTNEAEDQQKKEIAQETGLKEKGVASAYYRSIKKLRAEMGDVK